MRACFSTGIIPALIRLMRRNKWTRAAPPNNGMHPTRDTAALIYLNRVGGPVMPSVSCHN